MSDRYSRLLADLQAAPDEAAKDQLLLDFTLESLSPALRQAVECAAIPHWFDASFLAALLEIDLTSAEEIYSELTQLSFVEPYPKRGQAIHERTRNALLARLWQETPARFRAISQRAVAYCRAQPSDDGWQLEAIYHLLVADPQTGAEEMHDNGIGWQNPPRFAYHLIEAMTLSMIRFSGQMVKT